jgi:predicted nucleic acid-binding protein
LTNYYVDTSALSKRYVTEAGSTWIRSWIRPSAGNVIIVCDLTSVEGFSVFARLRRESFITDTRHIRLQAVLLWHIEHEYLTIPVDGITLAQARLLINRYPLRTLDAIQLASAQRAVTALGEPIEFVTGDKALRAAAGGEGFAIDDPNIHV